MKKILIIIAALIVIGIVAYLLLFSPGATKPNIEKPTDMTNISESHIAWLVNELGSYKLHANPTNGEKPIMEIISSKTYTVVIDSGLPVTTIGPASNPDIRITTQDQYIVELFNTTDFMGKVNEMYNEEKLTIQVLKSQDVLALKGYLSIYNEITS